MISGAKMLVPPAVSPHQEVTETEESNQGEGSSPFMVLQKLIPRILVASLAVGVWSISALAQTGEIRPRVVSNTTENEISCSPDDPVILSTAAVVEAGPVKPAISPTTPIMPASEFLKYQPSLIAAIDERLGARYRWGATGPNRFDCSGFVWSIFQSAGINFERASARTLWSRFAPAAPEEQYKFGTLVFFSGLAHVGVVADDKGFYHASRHHGVIYSPFNDYWVKRIDGFRRVPLPMQITD
jgi:peptidoglycan endopeptidase LytE